MKSKTRTLVFLITILTVLAVNAFWTFPALADDTPPPPTETPAVETPPTEEVPAADATVVEEVPATEAPVVEEPAAAVEETTPAEEPASTEETPAELLASVPEGTEVVVVNEEGETVPLVTQEAAEAIEFVDPIWCPTGVTPNNLNPACSASFGSLALLIAGFVPPGNGVIWIQNGDDADLSSTPLLIDGGVGGNWLAATNFSLTLKGGWIGTMGTTTITATPSVFDQSLSIINWNGDITLSDITLSGVTVGSSTNSAVLDIQTTKKITVTNVDVINNTGDNGVHFDNTAGIGNVVINDSTFSGNLAGYGATVNTNGTITAMNLIVNSNGQNGLVIISSGAVTLMNLNAMNNIGTGAHIDNTYGTGSVVINDSIFNGNAGIGLTVYSNGTITAKNLSANSNGQRGAYLGNIYSLTAKAVALTGSNNFNFNGSDGLHVISQGAITLSNVTAIYNAGGSGVFLDNCVYDGSSWCDQVISSPITIIGTSNFSNNGWDGLRVWSSGAIALENITANNNGTDAARPNAYYSYDAFGKGAFLHNSGSLQPKAITITGTNTFNDNASAGLYAEGWGVIKVNNLAANDNSCDPLKEDTSYCDGASLIGSGVTLTGFGNFNANYDDGMYTDSYGVVTLNSITANNNLIGNGLNVHSSDVISLNDITANGNGANGLFASTGKNITINNVDAGDNDWCGAYVTSGSNVVINNGIFTGNSLKGLVVITIKSITLNNIDAWDNGESGADLHAVVDFVNSGDIVVNDSTFIGNGDDGLLINSGGAITIKNLIANNNTGRGATILNYPLTPKPTLFTGFNNFSNNGSHGLYIRSYGAITLNNVTAIHNGNGHGAYIDNCFYDYANLYCNFIAVSLVSVKGTNNFSNNGWDGLRIWSQGAITLYNVTANDNGTNASRPGATNPADPYGTGKYDGTGKGVYLYNWAYPAQTITLTGTNTFNGNAETGLYMRSYGKITLNNITANDNGQSCNSPIDTCDGVHIRTSKGFSLLGYGVFNNNQDEGMEVSSYGAISLNNLYAEGNGYYGVFADSYGPGSAVGVLGTNTFVDNAYSGLWVWSEGIVTLNNITANGNGENGVFANNAWKWDNNLGDWVLAGKLLTLNGTNFFNENTSFGLELHSSGGITTNNVTALSNGDYGVYLDTCLYDATPDDCTGLPNKAVTMNGANNINNNSGDGLYVSSLGAIKINNLTASFNGGAGAILDNNWTATVGGVTLTGFANTSFNGVRGMAIYSRGAVLASNLTANSNNPVSALVNETFYDGVFINNATNPLKLMNVTLLGVNQFNDNWNTGLQISSYGIVVLNNITANNNGEPFDGTNNPTAQGNGVKVNNSGASSAKSVTLNGINFINGNLDDGLFIQSVGMITVNKVTANNNGGSGAYLDNQFDFINSTITLLGYGTFTGNVDTGLVVYSNGNITLNNVTANYSTGGGASIDNYSNTTTPVLVTLLGVNSFNGNASDGLVVYSDGAITLNNITANDNNGDGAYLNNTLYQIPLKVGNITLNGMNTFVNNVLNGLHFDATGNVLLNRIIADLNDDGVVDGNFSAGVFGTAAGTISLTCGSMNFNEGSGYDLTAGVGKLITLKGVFTYGNGFVDFSSVPTVSTRSCPLP